SRSLCLQGLADEAAKVVLLMNQRFRVSRSTRFAWFLNRLNKPCGPSSPGEQDDSLQVLSVLPHSWRPGDPPNTHALTLVPATQVVFLSASYRFVIILDLSPSSAVVDDDAGELLLDSVFTALAQCLGGLAQPFIPPGCCNRQQPAIYITILAHSGLMSPGSMQHDSPLCEDALEEQLSLKTSAAMVTPDVALIDAVRTATLALQLLPLNSMAGIIMITDGVTSMADVNYCDTLLTQIRINSIACSFVQVGNPYSYDQNFGHVSNVDLMCFVASATGGTYMKSCPDVSIDPLGGMNAYHWAFLSYTFQVPDSDARPHRGNHNEWRGVSCSALSTRHKKHSERELGASLGSVVSVRLREGYLIRDINIGKGTSHLEVQLFLPWRHDIRLVYTVVQPNAETGGRRASTRVELAMEGEYERLHAITCAARRTLATFHRRTVVRTFWQTLLGYFLLVHLQSFNSNPVFYTLPESTRNGVPLFYVPPTSTTPVLSLQQNISKESNHNQFASYWKPVLSLDSSKLQRWTHVHRIGLLLEHDTPLPRYVHSPSSTGRYSVVQSRMALAAVSLLLRDWASFVLVEGSSFVKFIFAEPDRPPVAFYLARVYVKASCMLIRLAFPLDTPLDVRLAVRDIEQRIVTLHFPQRAPPKEGTPRVRRKTSTVAPDSPNKGGGAPSEGPLQRPSDRPCTLLPNMNKERKKENDSPLSFCSFSTDEEDAIGEEAEGLDRETRDLTMVLAAECWVEPQVGLVSHSVPSSISHLKGLSYEDIPKSVRCFFFMPNWVSSVHPCVFLPSMCSGSCRTSGNRCSASFMLLFSLLPLPAVFHSLQGGLPIASQDVLLAMDACEESLQEVDVSAFLRALCGHARPYCQAVGLAPLVDGSTRGRNNDGCMNLLVLLFSGRMSNDVIFFDEQKMFIDIGGRYFKPVPSNPDYYFYCPESSGKEKGTGSGHRSTTDGELPEEDECEEVDDEDEEQEDDEDDGFGDGDESLSRSEGSEARSERNSADKPPLFVHLTCSVKHRSHHGCMPVRTLPTCLGQVLKCLELPSADRVYLRDLVVSLDIIVLTLPLEVDLAPTNISHQRYTSEGSASLSRSPVLHVPVQPADNNLLTRNLKFSMFCDDAFGILKQVEWLLQDEMVSALRSQPITAANLQAAVRHAGCWAGRGACLAEILPLQFVFGAEQSLQEQEMEKGLTSVAGISVSRSSAEKLETESMKSLDGAEVKGVETICKNDIMPECKEEKLIDVEKEIIGSEKGVMESDVGIEIKKVTERHDIDEMMSIAQESKVEMEHGSAAMNLEKPEGTTSDEEAPLLPDFWLVVRVQPDRLQIFTHARYDEHVCRLASIKICTLMLLLQALHDTRVCNSLLEAESEEDIWKQDSSFLPSRNRTESDESSQPKDYLAAALQLVPGHFSCDPVWSTLIPVHPRLKMGPSMGVSFAMQALHTVLNAFSVNNRKNMFVYQERATKSVFYLRYIHLNSFFSLYLLLIRGWWERQLPGGPGSPRGSETTRAVGPVDKHIRLVVHGVAQAGPEITEDLVKGLRRRLDEATLDVITVMLVRNCKLTPADVEFIQPPSSPPMESLWVGVPQVALPYLSAVIVYLRQNLLTFLHIPKYIDTDPAHHFQDVHHKHCHIDVMCGWCAQVLAHAYNWSGDMGALLTRALSRLAQWLDTRAYVTRCLLSQKMGLFHHYLLADAPQHVNRFLSLLIFTSFIIYQTSQLLHLQMPIIINPFFSCSLTSLCTTSAGVQPILNFCYFSMSLQVAELELMKLSARLFHYRATPLLFDPTWESGTATRTVGFGLKITKQAAALRPRADAWVQELCTAFMQQFLQFLQSHGFILIQLQPHTPSRRCMPLIHRTVKNGSSNCEKGTGGSSDQVFHLQKALPAGLVLVELDIIPFVHVSLFTSPYLQMFSAQVWLPLVEECAKVRSLFHLRSFSYDFHLRALQQYLLGRQLTFPPAYPLPDFLTLLSAHHRRSPAHARNHVHQGELTLSSGATPAHELFTYIIEHAQAYGLKPFRIGGTAGPGQNYALVSLSSRTGSYKDVSGMRHHDDFDVSLIICHVDLLTDEQPQGEEHHLRLQFFLLMTSCRELFPRLSADLRRVPDLRNPQTSFLVSTDSEDSSQVEMQSSNLPSPSLITPSATVSLQLLHPLLASEVRTSRDLLVSLVSRACSHCRRDSLWNRLILGEGSVPDRGVKLTRLMFVELEELLQVVYCRRVEDLDPQLVFFKSLSPAWYQSLMKVLQSHFPHSCRLFSSPDGNAHHLVRVIE
uniref:SZT2 subunit of KICSTOR complex n=1 Tax=Eptatretus burgeri TaxID=7764 RepID=A0A8C4QMF7_EPTBU